MNPWSPQSGAFLAGTRRGSSLLIRALGLALAASLGIATLAHAITAPSFIMQWGTSGSGNGQFNDPSGVAVDGSGNVYVVDGANNRIQKFTSGGVYLAQWGGAGNGPGQFNGPFGIAIANNKVYVTDTGNARVQEFTTAGVFVNAFGALGTGNGQFQQPLCIAVDGSGNLYVTDYNLNSVQKFTSAGAYLTQWGTTGSGSSQFNGAAGICVDGWGVVYIADSGNHRVQRFNGAGTWLGGYGGFGTGNGVFNLPFGITTNGAEEYVVDTFNNRMQIMTGNGFYLDQWNSGATFNLPHAAAVDGNFVYVADTQNNRIQKFGHTPTEDCANCLSPPDTCCEALPQVGGPWSNIVVGTRQAWTSYSIAVTIYDLNSSPIPAEDTNWASMSRYNGPGKSWNGDSLGTVFGLTLDEYGNIFVTHTSCYSMDLIGKVFNAGPGAVYRLDAVTGKITTFCKLPNFPDGSLPSGEDMPGLGNITYDCRNKQFFVTNHEDGKIYRIKPVGVNGPTGTVVETFDPLAPDNNLPGFAPIGERLWGVQWHGDRVYYSVWAQDGSEGTGPNEIRSVGLLPSGAFAAGTDKHELFLPFLAANTYSMPVSDISFSANGKMLLAERCISTKTYAGSHASRALEYTCSGGCWVTANQYLVGDCCSKENSAGGVDYDRKPFGGPASPIGRVWASGDAIHLGFPYPDVIYGYQGMRPNLAFGSNVTGMLIDSDGSIVDPDKTFIGDIEAPGCPAVTTGSICGQKFYDLNHNGVKDGGEFGMPGWTIVLNGPGGPYTATTDGNGNYCFIGLNPGNYTLSEVGQIPWIQTAPAGGTYAVTLAAGQTVYARDFGNYPCGGAIGGSCVSPPPQMVAWWPFNEATTSTTAGDVTHVTPPRNVAQLVGGASIASFGQVKNMICFANESQYAKVPNSNQIALTFGAGPFAIDAWVNPNNSGASNRMIVEKRKLIGMSPYRTLGWALYMNGQQLFLELGIGISTQIVPGPTISAGTWSHIAVSVDRAPAAGRWYVNGSLVPAFNFVPTPGPVSSTADLYMGQTSPPFGIGPGFQGCIDELELFNTANPSAQILPAASVAAIYNAGGLGKCPEYLSIPQVTTICKNQTSVQVCFNICNNTGSLQTYHWSVAALGISAGCSVAGPTSFSPPAGVVTVPSGGCSLPICITIPRPAGLTTHNATSCFAVSFINDATGACYTRNSTIRADMSCWCVTPVQSGVVTVAAFTGTSVGVGIGRPCDTSGTLDYRVLAVSDNPDHGDPLAVSLNQLPPGEPVFGTLSVGPSGNSQVNVNVSYPNGYDMAAPYRIVLEADTDGDGQYERCSETQVVSSYDSSTTVAVPPSQGFVESIRLITSPNPFLAGSAIGFTLSQADDVDLGVYDLSGRLVRSLQHGRVTAGPHRFEWNGRDDHGRRVAAGVYFVRMDAPGRHLDAKLVKLQ